MGARRTLVIGIGHPDRGDDAAGRVAAARLKAENPAGMTIIETDGEAGRLVDLLAEADDVIIVDAGLSGAEPGTIHRFNAVTAPLPRPMFAMSSHAIGLVESIELARALGSLPRSCTVFAIEAERFDLGVGLSPRVAGAVDAVCARILDEICVEAG